MQICEKYKIIKKIMQMDLNQKMMDRIHTMNIITILYQ